MALSATSRQTIPEMLDLPAFKNSDGSSCFFSDGSTWAENQGSVLAGKANYSPQRMFREGSAPKIVRTSTIMGRG